MSARLTSPLAGDIVAFLEFKRALGHGYARGEFTLRAFDRFVAARFRTRTKRPLLSEIFREWLTRKADRKPITVSVVTKPEGVLIENNEGRRSERSVVLVCLTEDRFDDAAIDAQVAA